MGSIRILVLLISFLCGLSRPVALDCLDIESRLKAAYPDFVERIVNDQLLFKDGTYIAFDDGRMKSFAEWLEYSDVKDMFRFKYPVSSGAEVPEINFDPGRGRAAMFFRKVYGDCRDPGFRKTLVAVDWVVGQSKQKLLVTSRNGVSEQLRKVALEIRGLPPRFWKFLSPSAGTFMCRQIAGSDQMSAHSFGIAIDIALKHSNYWKWDTRDQNGAITYINEIPLEIVDIFERHGFIWGGRWYHYDTMHFEYRPELLPFR